MLAAVVIANILWAILTGLDVWTTNRFLSAGTGVEDDTNLVGAILSSGSISKWLQVKFGPAWWIPKVIFSAGLAACDWLAFLGGAPQLALGGMAITDFMYAIIVWQNYKLGES